MVVMDRIEIRADGVCQLGLAPEALEHVREDATRPNEGMTAQKVNQREVDAPPSPGGRGSTPSFGGHGKLHR